MLLGFEKVKLFQFQVHEPSRVIKEETITLDENTWKLEEEILNKLVEIEIS